MEITHEYNCGKQVAYQKIDNFLDELTEQYSEMISNPYKKWNETKDNMAFSFNAKGFNIKGNVKLKEDKLILTGDLPWAARLFKGKIESTIKSKLEEMLN